ncbi:leucine-rich repeat protein [Treponema sp. OMZ 857]|uniref:leucine-rich repeat protein n=1 Tax=Treponema sp. OMZ 857 TaxID=1643513 RepID=UPI0020A39F37|nr:leucine-rich repeat protein [Treponema sp. OMZ 857]UTC44493.1 leucine-rich repeat protein [Treponema sp. OMZ 857]
MNTDTTRTRKFFNRITVAVLAVIVSLLCTACPQNGAPGNNTPSYTQVPFAQLDNYLNTTASDSTVNYIEVTGLTKEKLVGTKTEVSPLGKILNEHPSKKVALKFGTKIEELEDMYKTFTGCTNLIRVSGLPEGVIYMTYCFADCENLMQAPVIPKSVEGMYQSFYGCTSLKTIVLKCNYNPEKDEDNDPYFEDAFAGCTALTAGGIKVPAGQLATYQANAAVMGVTEDKFAAE